MRTATNVNIWNKKSNKMAIVACKQNVCNAGILVRLPTRNASASQIVAVTILGPTYLSPSITLYYNLSNGCLYIAFLMINILSTPIARTRKGMTSALIIVKPMPIYDMTPIEDTTDANTIKIPISANENPEDIIDGN
jgi:hypothetical protein